MKNTMQIYVFFSYLRIIMHGNLYILTLFKCYTVPLYIFLQDNCIQRLLVFF